MWFSGVYPVIFTEQILHWRTNSFTLNKNYLFTYANAGIRLGTWSPAGNYLLHACRDVDKVHSLIRPTNLNCNLHADLVKHQ